MTGSMTTFGTERERRERGEREERERRDGSNFKGPKCWSNKLARRRTREVRETKE